MCDLALLPFALAIPTYLIQSILVQFWPSEHPLIESLKLQREPQFVAIALFVAVISAPLTEEFFFRVLFQGWLEKMFDPWACRSPSFGMSLLVGNRAAETENASPTTSHPADQFHESFASPAIAPSYSDPLNPYAPPLALATNLVPLDAITSNPSPQAAAAFPRWITDVLAISTTAALFALAHVSHGPDWLPLFFFAVGLGYLYRRTHRILPGLVVHFLLNLLSMTALLIEIYHKR